MSARLRAFMVARPSRWRLIAFLLWGYSTTLLAKLGFAHTAC
jgi:hypothetical protein